MEITGSGVNGSNSAGVGVGDTDRPGRLDHDALQSQTEPEDRQPTLAGEGDGSELALDAPDTEAAGDQHPVDVGQRRHRTGVGLAVIGGDPPDLHLGAVFEPTGAQRLGHRRVGIRQVDVLAHQRNSDGFLRLVHPAKQIVPLRPVHVTERQVQPAHHVRVELLAVQHLGDVVDGRCVRGGDDAVDIDVAHQRDLVLERLGNITVTPQDQRVGGDTDAAQCGHRVLGRLGLELAGRSQVGHQRHMQEEAVLPADLVAYLAGGLEERQRFDIADRAADFGDHDVGAAAGGVGLGHRQDAALDLVGDVRNHLHGVTQILAAAFLRDHRRVDLTGGHVGRLRQIAVQEPLIVADVEVGLRAVLRDEHLTVLERVHGARIHVQVGIEFLHRHLQPPRGEQLTEA